MHYDNEYCHVCENTKIEYVEIEMPDGYGGFDIIEEPRPCRRCH